MLGLRTDRDLRAFGSQSQNKRSHKFAEKLSGRFFVSGISGGFQKHKRLQENDQLKEHGTEQKYSFEPLLERNCKDVLRNEALALLEMEQKLADIRERKEKRKIRDETRARNKVIFNAAGRIQRAFVAHFRVRRQNAIATIMAFLK